MLFKTDKRRRGVIGTLRSPSSVALAAAAVLAGAAAAVTRVRRRRARTAEPVARRPVTCACGQAFEVSGLDRHRVYWMNGEPVLGEQCPSCARPLPVSSP